MDVNEVFENLLFAEEVAEQSGYKEGYSVGKNKLKEGYHLGYHRASLIAAQLGYYNGVLIKYRKNSSEKVSQSAQKLLQKIQDFPKNNDETIDILALVENIKFKFNKFCSLAKINSSYPEADKLDF